LMSEQARQPSRPCHCHPFFLAPRSEPARVAGHEARAGLRGGYRTRRFMTAPPRYTPLASPCRVGEDGLSSGEAHAVRRGEGRLRGLAEEACTPVEADFERRHRSMRKNSLSRLDATFLRWRKLIEAWCSDLKGCWPAPTIRRPRRLELGSPAQ